MVGRVDLDTDRDPVRPRVQGRGQRAQRLGEDARGTTMEQAVGLDVACHRHGADDTFRAGFDDGDPHPVGERVLACGLVGLHDPQCVVLLHCYLRVVRALACSGKTKGPDPQATTGRSPWWPELAPCGTADTCKATDPGKATAGLGRS